jgi:hypothetical protein
MDITISRVRSTKKSYYYKPDSEEMRSIFELVLHEQEGRYPGLRMDVTISRVRSTENRVIVSSAVSLYCEYFI